MIGSYNSEAKELTWEQFYESHKDWECFNVTPELKRGLMEVEYERITGKKVKVNARKVSAKEVE